MTRYAVTRATDVRPVPNHEGHPGLPPVDWRRLHAKAPKHVPIHYLGPNAKLPQADIIVMTWTIHEWSALDHVFLNSGTVRNKTNMVWRDRWHLFTREAPESKLSPLWGYYQMVEMNGMKILLFKSDAHLAHPYWIKGLSEMLKIVIQEVKPQRVYSIGTAGGTDEDACLGDVVITNSAHIQLKKAQNVGFIHNNKTFTCKSWFPSKKLLPEVEKQLFFRMSNVVSHNELEYLLDRMQLHTTSKRPKLKLVDILNKPMQPRELHDPKVIAHKGKPLLTTDFYYISDKPTTKYSVLEMDDAVVALNAVNLGVQFAFVRNISDPIVRSKTPGGNVIPPRIRQSWSGTIYDSFGIYTSFNGALTTWATIAAERL